MHDGAVGNSGGVRPATALQYEPEPAVRLVGVVRAVGVLAVVFGIAGLVLLPFQLYGWDARPRFYGSASRALDIGPMLFSVVAVLALSICLTIAGVGCLRRRPRCRRLLTMWAWGSLGYAAFGIATTAYYMHASWFGSPMSFEFAAALVYQVKVWLSASVLPVVVVVLMRHAAIRDVFR